MATVSFISYQKQSPGTLAGVAGYVSQDKKTVEPKNGHQLLSGQNCSPKFAHREFLATRDMHRKKSPVYFYHYTQSFHPDEPITTQDAHRIAKEFAAQAWPDSEVLIATHVDANHIHSHFIVNAVCCESGKMLRQGPKTLEHLRKLSDDICKAYQLSILCNKKKNNVQGMSGREYRSAVKGQSWKLQLMTTIDHCMSLAASPEGFRQEMKKYGYDMVWSSTRKHITYITPTGMRCRDSKLHESKYLKENMEYEFRIRKAIIAGRIEKPEPTAATSGETGTDDQSRRMDLDNEHPGEHIGAAGAHRAPVERNQSPTSTNAEVEAIRGPTEGTEEDRQPIGTGWETERETLFSSQAAVPQPGVVSGLAADPSILTVLGDHLLQLGKAVSQPQQSPPVTGPRSTPDKKLRQKEREKKIAAGHKADDHEDFTQTVN